MVPRASSGFLGQWKEPRRNGMAKQRSSAILQFGSHFSKGIATTTRSKDATSGVWHYYWEQKACFLHSSFRIDPRNIAIRSDPWRLKWAPPGSRSPKAFMSLGCSSFFEACFHRLRLDSQIGHLSVLTGAGLLQGELRTRAPAAAFS